MAARLSAPERDCWRWASASLRRWGRIGADAVQWAARARRGANERAGGGAGATAGGCKERAAATAEAGDSGGQPAAMAAAAAAAGSDDARCVRLSAERARALLADVDTLLFDCDGVLWRGETAVPGAPEALTALRARGKRLGFITNNSSKTREAYAEKLQRLGFGGARLEVFGTAYCTALYLRRRLAGAPGPKAYVLGGEALAAELRAVGVACVGVGPEPLQGDSPSAWLNAPLEPGVGAVVVGFDPHFSYMKLTKAVRYLQQPGCLLVGTNMDNRLPLENGCFIAGPCAPGRAAGGRAARPSCPLTRALSPLPLRPQVPAVWSEPWRWPPSARPTS